VILFTFTWAAMRNGRLVMPVVIQPR
jgi:hypothetical protein